MTKVTKGSLRQGSIPKKPRFRSVPDVMVLNSQLLAELLIKYQRLPRGFFWNTSLPSLVCQLFWEICRKSYFYKLQTSERKTECLYFRHYSLKIYNFFVVIFLTVVYNISAGRRYAVYS